MRTTVSIKDPLWREARRAARVQSPSELVTRGLEALVRESRKRALLEWLDRGRTGFTVGRLRSMRRLRGHDAG